MTHPIFLENPYQRTLSTRVISCTPAADGFGVILESTLLYPEGGGQPSDHGTLSGHPVRRLERTAHGEVIHLLDQPLPEGPVEVVLDWTRRFDHMQQHTAQHLLTALALDRLGHPTIAFHLGAEISDIELDTAAIPDPLLADLETAVNAEIRACRPVTIRNVQPDEMEGLGVRSRGLPEGHRGGVRLVEIQGIDLNTCGGTHLSDTAQIQALKLLHTEKLKRGLRLYWVAGNRVLAHLGACMEREHALCTVLTCAPQDHATSVARLMEETRTLSRTLKGLRQEVASQIAQYLARSEKPVVGLHRPDADLPWLNLVATEVLRIRPDLLMLLTCPGAFLLAGPPDRVSALGPRVAETLQGRGGGAKGRYQGKAERVDRWEAVVESLEG